MVNAARILCYFGHHLRSRGRARRNAVGWHSYCRRCGAEMVKAEGGEWQVVDIDDGDDDAPDHGDATLTPGLVTAGIDDRDEAPASPSRWPWSRRPG